MKKIFYYDVLMYDNIEYTLVCSYKGLCFVGGENENINFAKKYLCIQNIIYNKEKLKIYKEQILSYLQGEIYNFNFALDIKGTTFRLRVWEELQKIPYGTTETYESIAEKIGKKNAVRAVATAIGKNPLIIVIPCHRVIGKDGKLRGYRGGLDMKARLLNLEKNFLKKYTSNENNKD